MFINDNIMYLNTKGKEDRLQHFKVLNKEHKRS